MNTIKSILIATTLICAAAMSTVSAQQPAAKTQWDVAIGDSVMIKRDCQAYMTGEKPSVWVYDKVHTVRQLGTKRFPEGVLLMNIYSWVCEECLAPVHPKEPAVPTQPAEPIVEEEPVVEEPVEEEPVVEPVPEEPVAEVTPVAEEQKPVVEEPEEVQTVRAQGDSIHSKQNFKSGYDRFTVGVRGGAASLLHNTTQGKWTCGGDVLLDLQYAHYWTNDSRPVEIGLITGVSVGYSQSGMKTAVDMDAILTDGEGDPIHYNVRADEVKENDSQVQLEIPLLLSLIHQSGFFFNIGPRLMLPVYTPYNQSISNNENTYIDAYFQRTGVNVTNEVITGKLAETDYKTKGTDNGNLYALNIMVGAEIGYEWILKSGNSLGLGAYADYCVYSTYKNNTSTQPLIQVTPPVGSEIAQVEVLSATKTYARSLGYFDAGIKLAYHFNFPKKKQYKNARLF